MTGVARLLRSEELAENSQIMTTTRTCEKRRLPSLTRVGVKRQMDLGFQHQQPTTGLAMVRELLWSMTIREEEPMLTGKPEAPTNQCRLTGKSQIWLPHRAW